MEYVQELYKKYQVFIEQLIVIIIETSCEERGKIPCTLPRFFHFLSASDITLPSVRLFFPQPNLLIDVPPPMSWMAAPELRPSHWIIHWPVNRRTTRQVRFTRKPPPYGRCIAGFTNLARSHKGHKRLSIEYCKRDFKKIIKLHC